MWLAFDRQVKTTLYRTNLVHDLHHIQGGLFKVLVKSKYWTRLKLVLKWAVRANQNSKMDFSYV